MHWGKIGQVVEKRCRTLGVGRLEIVLCHFGSINRNLSGTCFAVCSRGFHLKINLRNQSRLTMGSPGGHYGLWNESTPEETSEKRAERPPVMPAPPVFFGLRMIE
jgi:hypothetical protein